MDECDRAVTYSWFMPGIYVFKRHILKCYIFKRYILMLHGRQQLRLENQTYRMGENRCSRTSLRRKFALPDTMTANAVTYSLKADFWRQISIK